MSAPKSCRVLDDRVEAASGNVSIGTMHLSKGLEFRAVVVMACDDDVVPLQERIESVGDDAHLMEVYVDGCVGGRSLYLEIRITLADN